MPATGDASAFRSVRRTRHHRSSRTAISNSGGLGILFRMSGPPSIFNSPAALRLSQNETTCLLTGYDANLTSGMLSLMDHRVIVSKLLRGRDQAQEGHYLLVTKNLSRNAAGTLSAPHPQRNHNNDPHIPARISPHLLHHGLLLEDGLQQCPKPISYGGNSTSPRQQIRMDCPDRI